MKSKQVLLKCFSGFCASENQVKSTVSIFSASWVPPQVWYRQSIVWTQMPESWQWVGQMKMWEIIEKGEEAMGLHFPHRARRKVARALLWRVPFPSTPGTSPREMLCNEIHNRYIQVFNILGCAKFHSWSQVHNNYVPLSWGRCCTLLRVGRAAQLPQLSK